MKDIIAILENNAKATPTEIAALTGRSTKEVEELIDQAEKQKIILGYKTVINRDLLYNGEEVLAFVEVRMTPQHDVGFDGIAQRIARFPEVRSLQLLSGVYDLAVLFSGNTMQQVASFVAMKLAALQEVNATTTHFLLKRYKEDGIILSQDEGTRRLPLSP